MIRISLVSYFNSLPYKFAIQELVQEGRCELSLDTPAECAEKLIANEADLGLIPVAVIPLLKNPVVIKDFGIGANGKVDSVLLLSQVPLSELKEVFLDYQSRTSVKLFEVLCNAHWHISPKFVKSKPGYESEISGTTGGVVIGDRAMKLKNSFNYCYDLSEVWKNFTGMPFVFAVWVANKQLPEEDLSAFREAIVKAISNRPAILDSLGVFDEHKRRYILESINYELGQEHHRSLDRFLAFISK